MLMEFFKQELRSDDFLIRLERSELLKCKNLITVIECPSDIRNVGSIIRNVNAMGVEKTYIIDPQRKLPRNWESMREKKSLIKTSASAIKWSFVQTFASTHDCFQHLESNHFVSLVTSPHAKGRKNFTVDEADFTQPRLAVWFGNESTGVSDLALERSDFCISISMSGVIESLNVGTTSGIILHEITKQRRKYQMTGNLVANGVGSLAL